MNFNNQSPFSHIYREIINKTYEQNLHYKRKKDYPGLYLNKNNVDESSIDNLLSQESIALSDKLTNTAFAISDRLNINSYFNYIMNINSLKIGNQIILQNESYVGKYRSSDRRVSMLESQLVTIDKHMLDEKVKCWQDIVKQMSYFITLFHEYKNLHNDKKLLG